LSQLQDGVTLELKNSISAVNGLAQQVATVNAQISAVRGTGHAPNDLLDERDRLIGQISDYIQVTTVAADDGSTSVFIGGGQSLVLGGTATALAPVADPYDASKVHIGIGNGAVTRALPDDSFTGGSIAGLLRFQGEDLTDARNLLGQMATVVATRLNEQQSYGLNLLQPAGTGGALFALGTPQALPSSGNTGGASLQLAIDDASLLQASDYELRTDPSGTAGAYQITRLVDGTVFTAVPSGAAGNYQINQVIGGVATPLGPVGTGIVVDGVRIAVTGTPDANDRFLLRPANGAMQTMTRVLDDPRGIAAASPVTATLGATNTGTASVAALNVVDSAYAATKLTIKFTSDNGDWDALDATNAVVASGTWTAGQPVAVNGWELRLNGAPKTNDTVVVDATPNPAASNGNALALLGVRDEALVGRHMLAGGALSSGQTITDAYASALANIGVRVQTAQAASTISTGVASSSETARANASGVNLDEEAARLIQFQQSYQAAAKVLQVAQTIFDTLLQATSR
jgi:flagellar hook-associated protein 1